MGIQQMLLGAGASGAIITVATSVSHYGYHPNGTGLGSINPSPYGFQLAPIDGATEIDSALAYDFFIQADGAYAGGQFGAFNSVLVQNDAGSIITFLPGSATYSAALKTWTWGTGSSPIWTATSVGVNRSFAYT